MAAIDRMMGSIRYKAQIITRTNKLESGIMSTGILGFAIGVIVAVLFVLIPVMLVGLI